MPLSKRTKRLFVQKAFWLDKDTARRLDVTVRRRKKAQPKYTERIAMALALRDFVAKEEKELGIEKPAASHGAVAANPGHS